MSAEPREPMGIRHMTVVPKNFEPPTEDGEDDE
jgi:hypothetical protein